MNIELQKTQIKMIFNQVRFDLDQQQREYFLQQQIENDQEELGGSLQEEEMDEMSYV
jgi:ATP-dependent Lon protease